MINININKEQFKFTYLNDYATFLLENLLNDFVTVSLRFGKEADLPLLKKMSKYSEEEMVAISLESYTEMLEALAQNAYPDYLETLLQKWISNKINVIDKEDLTAADLSLVFYLRRKTFAHFLDIYTKNVVLQKFIIAETDVFTSQQELVFINVYLQMQKEKLTKANEKLLHHQSLLIDVLEQEGMGSFIIDYKDLASSFFSAGYKRILEMEGRVPYMDYIKHVHPEDHEMFRSKIDHALKNGGPYEFIYRHLINGHEKKIWTKGTFLLADGERSVARGIIKEVK